MSPDVVEEVVAVGGRTVVIERPRDEDVHVDEAEFVRDERMPYWADLWPSAILLARTIAGRSLRGKRVVELGCGLGLPSIVAALAGGRVLATDAAAEAVAATLGNAARNDAVLESEQCDWREPESLVRYAPWDLVIAADVLYESRNVAPLLALLPQLTAGHGEVWLADPHRAPAERLLADASLADWEVSTLAESTQPRLTVHRLRPS